MYFCQNGDQSLENKAVRSETTKIKISNYPKLSVVNYFEGSLEPFFITYAQLISLPYILLVVASSQ